MHYHLLSHMQSVPTKGAHRVAELAYLRSFLGKRIRLTHRAQGDANVKTESTARNITVTFSERDAGDIFGKIKVNTQSLFDASKEGQQGKFLKLVQENRTSVSPTNVDITSCVDRNKQVKVKVVLRCSSVLHCICGLCRNYRVIQQIQLS